MINIQVTRDFRLVSDSHNFIVQERYIVDPSKAPGFKLQEGVEPPPLREEYRDLAYYSHRPDSLALAIDLIAIKTAARSEATSLRELVEVIRAEYQRATDVINAAIQPPK